MKLAILQIIKSNYYLLTKPPHLYDFWHAEFLKIISFSLCKMLYIQDGGHFYLWNSSTRPVDCISILSHYIIETPNPLLTCNSAWWIQWNYQFVPKMCKNGLKYWDVPHFNIQFPKIVQTYPNIFFNHPIILKIYHWWKWEYS